MLCFKVYWQLMIGEDTPEICFYGIKHNEI